MPDQSLIVAEEGGVFVDRNPYSTVGQAEIEFLKDRLVDSPRGRTRLCTHKKPDDRVHEMFISFVGGNYVRPAKHIGKDESLHLLEGSGEYYFFDSAGNVVDIVPLGTYRSGRQFYCRIPAMREHAVVIRSDQLAFHEATTGPFDRKDTILSPWSPAEGDVAAIKQWTGRLAPGSDRPRAVLTSRQAGAGLFVADQDVVSVGASEIADLKSKMQRAGLGEIRLNLHRNASVTLQEGIVIRRRDGYELPRVLTDDASVHVLEGAVDVFAFDAQGALLNHVRLRGDDPDAKFYARTPAHSYRCLLPRSDVLVTHEVNAASPAGTEETYASWAPSVVDTGASAAFLEKLRGMVPA